MAAISESEIRLRARLAVLEQSVAHLYAMNIRIVRMIANEDHAAMQKISERLFAEMRHSMRTKTFPDLDPTMSDLWSAELEDRLDHILSGALEMLALDQNAKFP